MGDKATIRARRDEIRPGERAVAAPTPGDAGLVFIGTIRTPWSDRAACPRQGNADGPPCRIEIDPLWAEALTGIEAYKSLEVLYWLHLSRRDLVLQSPRHDGEARGTFALRSPVRPNPIGVSVVTLERREGTTLVVRGLDCIDGTRLLDLKPWRGDFMPGGAAPAATDAPRA